MIHNRKESTSHSTHSVVLHRSLEKDSTLSERAAYTTTLLFFAPASRSAAKDLAAAASVSWVVDEAFASTVRPIPGGQRKHQRYGRVQGPQLTRGGYATTLLLFAPASRSAAKDLAAAAFVSSMVA